MEPPTAYLLFSDSEDTSTACYPSSPPPLPIPPPEEEPASAFGPFAAADVVPLRRLSEHFLSLLRSPPEFSFCSDARIVVSSGESEREVAVHRCVLSARSSFFLERFAAGKDGGKMELKELLPEFSVEYEALAAVLEYIYGGRVEELPRGVAECADEKCGHEACWPAVHFMIQVLYAAATFKIQELVSLFQRRLLDILQNIVVDDVLQVLFVANLCGSSCLKLLTKCLEIIIKSNVDYMTLEKRLSPEIFKKIKESRSNLGLDEQELLRFTDRNVERIYKALDSDDIQLVQLLLEEGHTTLDDAFALHYAVAHCDLKVIKELLDLEIADVNLRNQRGYTVLHIAAMRHDPDIILSVLTKGAKTSDLTPDNRKALQISKRLTKSIDYYSQVEQGKVSPKGRTCIEMLEYAEMEDSFAKENFLPFAMENYDLPRKLLYLESRVWLAALLFPKEAEVAMKTARVDGTLKFKPSDTLLTLHWGNKRPEEDETTMPSDMTEEQLLRMEALNKTVKLGMRYFPRCSRIINKFLGDDLSDFNISSDTTTDDCRNRYKELHDEIMNAFTQDKEELNRSASGSILQSKSSRSVPTKRAKRR